MRVAFIQFVDDIVIGASGAGYVMGSLIEGGHDVDFYKMPNSPLTAFGDKLNYWITLNNISKHAFIFMSCLSMDTPFAYNLAREIKRKNPNAKIIMGGPHPTIVKGKILEECSDIDYICVGEGEEFVIEFLQKIHYSHDIKNLGYRKDGKIIINPINKPQDLSKLPAFPYHLYKRKDIVDPLYNFSYVKATRGCQYNCTFCCNSIFTKMYPGKYLRYRPIESVIEEIQYLRDNYNPGHILFSDEMMLTNKEYAKGLFKKINMPFAFLARAEHLTNDIVKLAADCGCKYISIGVECGDEKFRKEILNRHMTNKQLIDAFENCRRNGIYTTALTMIGFPYPNDNELTESTINLIETINPNYLQTSIFYPFVGTPLYDYCVKNDLIDPEKQKRVTSCFEESILRGASLKDKRDAILKRFNTKPFLDGIKW
jgi:radical SAM superfamily enzyme YgiQ (UPF0313 family)